MMTSIGAKIATWFFAPFLAVSAMFAGHAAIQTNQSINKPVISSSTSAQGNVSAQGNGSANVVIKIPPLIPAPTPKSNVSIYSISSASAKVGANVTITGSGFTNDNTILMDGLIAARGAVSTSANGKETLTFAIPNSLSPNCAANMACPMFMRLTTAGNYSVTIENANGTSNAVVLAVTGSANIISPAQPMQPISQ